MAEWLINNAVALILAAIAAVGAYWKARIDVNGLGIRVNNLKADIQKTERDVAEIEGELKVLTAIQVSLQSIDGRLGRLENWLDRQWPKGAGGAS